MKKITVKNISNGIVVLSIPDNNRYRQELVPGREVGMPAEIYEELSFDPGFLGLVNNGYIAISGLEEEVPVSNKKDFKEIAALIESKNITAFNRFLQSAAPAEKESAVAYVIDNNITMPGIVTLIKQYCDVDVIQAITIRHQANEV